MYLVQHFVVDANACVEYRDGRRVALRLQPSHAALRKRHPVLRDEVHLVHEEEYRCLRRALLPRVQTIAVVTRHPWPRRVR